MHRLREALTSTTSSVSSVLRAPAEVEGQRGGTSSAAFSNLRRRATQSIMERLGRADTSDDTEFEARRGRVLEYEAMLREARAAAGTWLDASRAKSHTGGALLAKFLTEAYSGAVTAAVAHVAPAAAQLSALDGAGRGEFGNAFIRDVLLPLDALIAEAKDLQGEWQCEVSLLCAPPPVARRALTP